MEHPNLNYIEQLSGDDNLFKKKMIDIIKDELPREIAVYQQNMKGQDYKLASENVHKLKHKISIFGLERAYHITQEYEENLLNGTVNSKDEFENILEIMQCFVNGL